MKRVAIGNLEISKLICGTNSIYGRSHFSMARDIEYRQRFGDDRVIERLFRHCLDLGINAVESSANERITAIMAGLRADNKAPLHFIGSTRIDETSTMNSHHQKLNYLIETRAAIGIIHAQYVDRDLTSDSIPGLERMLDKIHNAGLLAGISTHRVATVELCERKGYAVDTYLFPLNLTGFVYPGYEGTETVGDRVDVVRGVSKPFILIKALGAGRIPPDEGLQFVAENSKPNDLVAIGFGTEAEVDEGVKYFEKYF
jgi:hypothetical protein